MILKALSDFYDILLKEGKVPKYYLCSMSVDYKIEIDSSGKHTITRNDNDGGREIIPFQEARSGDKPIPYFLCDNMKFIFGIDEKGNFKNEKGKSYKNYFNAFRELHETLLEKIEHSCAEAKAVLNFLRNWDVDKALEDEELTKIRQDIKNKKNPTFIFKIDNYGRVHENEHIINVWNEKRKLDIEKLPLPKGQCSVSGKHNVFIERKHQQFKFGGYPNSQTSGSAIVSYNIDSFSYFGKKKENNTTVGEEVVYNYGTALKYIMEGDSNHNIRIADTMVTFWGISSSKDMLEISNKLLDMNWKYSIKSRKEVGEVFKKLFTGNKIDFKGIENYIEDKDIKFYILGIAPNMGRVIIKFFIQTSFGKFKENILKHYEDMEIEREFEEQPKYFSWWKTINAIEKPKNNKSKREDEKKENSSIEKHINNLTSSVIRAMIEDTQYPIELYNLVLSRIISSRNINYYYVSIIKAYLSRKIRKQQKREKLEMSLNKDETNIGYLLGRLFAVYNSIQVCSASEKKQLDKTKDKNTNITENQEGAEQTIELNGDTPDNQDEKKETSQIIVDRYLKLALRNPNLAFIRIEQISISHQRKLNRDKKGIAVKLGKNMDEILEKIGKFPSKLTSEEKGMFIIGYHLQRIENYK